MHILHCVHHESKNIVTVLLVTVELPYGVLVDVRKEHNRNGECKQAVRREWRQMDDGKDEVRSLYRNSVCQGPSWKGQ